VVSDLVERKASLELTPPFSHRLRKIGKHDGEEQNHGNQTIEQLILPRVATKQVRINRQQRRDDRAKTRT